MNNNHINKILLYISKSLNTSLNKDDIEFIKQEISANPNSNVNDIIYKLRERSTVDNNVDIGTKADDNNNAKLNVMSIFNNSNPYHSSLLINPSSKEYYSYVMLDTNNVDSLLSTETFFVWNLNDGTPSYRTGTINIPHKIYPIKRMRLGRITFANMHYADFYKIFLSTSNRIATTFHNFGSQALIAQNRLKYHFLHKFIYDQSYRGGSLTITPFYSNRGWFRFNKKFNKPDQLQVSFADIFTPESPISVPLTECSFSAVQYFNHAIFSVDFSSYSYYLEIDKSERLLNFIYDYIDSSINNSPNDNGTMQEQVLISGFTTDDPAADAAVIAAYNGYHTLTRVFSIDNSFDNRLSDQTAYWNPPTDISSITYAGSEIPVTITLIYKPRTTAVLELISEAEEQDV